MMDEAERTMNVGDWVFFKTRNWPKDVQVTRIDLETGDAEDKTGQGFYQGRGKIVGIAGENYTVREGKSNRLVEVGPHPEDEIRPVATISPRSRSAVCVPCPRWCSGDGCLAAGILQRRGRYRVKRAGG